MDGRLGLQWKAGGKGSEGKGDGCGGSVVGSGRGDGGGTNGGLGNRGCRKTDPVDFKVVDGHVHQFKGSSSRYAAGRRSGG